MTVTISRQAIETILADARNHAGREACGLLFGGRDRIEAASPAKNVAADPAATFEIDPQRLFAAIRAERAGGPVIAGHYHSHPAGDFRPSPRDAAAADPDGRLWLIVGQGGWSLWRAVARGAHLGRFDPVVAVQED
ncbi:MAG: hypothetical protein ABS87_06755 [Sphingomonas sp. SCN 67-18]|uniref:M67 family metallopeptidase n=1 Tax=uncultured Sphingomonas sp. TaxID=158754 RepID=UPI00086B10F8|nr:M67 family metallopeptidase [Sphingomonas sp. SCN 67-18]ODU21518.1 MAG: hypothetical protein ABS87_06755 [Sphingomonas sp. SCN 67-18]